MMDQSKKTELIEYIQHREESGEGEILLAPSMYFDGYDDPQCTICANNPNPVSTAEFAARLSEIGERADVHSVFVRFYDYADALEDSDSWIGSDSVYLITRASPDAVRAWFEDFEIADVWAEDDLTKFSELQSLPKGHQLIAVWWD